MAHTISDEILKMEDKIEIEDIKRLNLRDGDIIVLRLKNKIDSGMYARIKEQIDAALAVTKKEFKVIILDNGSNLEIIGGEE